MTGPVLMDKRCHFLLKLIAYPPSAACPIFTFINYQLRQSYNSYWDRFLPPMHGILCDGMLNKNSLRSLLFSFLFITFSFFISFL